MSIQPYNKAQQGSLPGSDKRYLDQELIKIQTAIGSIEQAVGPWTPYTPVVTPGTGAITAYTAAGRYAQIGKLVLVQIDITITTNGSGATYVAATLPASGITTQILPGREAAVVGKMLQGQIAGNTVLIYNYDNTYPGGNSYRLVLSGSYESA